MFGGSYLNAVSCVGAGMELHKELHGVISQKMILFITTAVRTSSPKK
jgi:hypothetical protein